MAVKLKPPSCMPARIASLPILPKPLMPTLTFILCLQKQCNDMLPDIGEYAYAQRAMAASKPPETALKTVPPFPPQSPMETT